MTDNPVPEPVGAAGADAPIRRGWRWVRKSTMTTIIVVFLIVLLAATLGIGASHAISALGGPTGSTGSGPVSGNSGTATTDPGSTGNTGNTSDGANTEESGAPVILQGGGAQPGYGAYNALECIDVNNCVAVGADSQGHGVIGTTNNGATSWTNNAPPTGTPALEAVACGTAQDCVAVGQGAILHSTDAGATWTMQPPPVPKTTLVGVQCAASACLAVGGSVNPTAGPYAGQILRSTDGGSTWSADSLPPGSMAVGAVTCPTAANCIAVGGGILTSTDGGQTWQVATVPGGTGVLRSISCTSTTQCVAIGPNPIGVQQPDAPAVAIMTNDGGASWSSVAMPAATAALGNLTCAIGGSCFAVGAGPSNGLAALWSSGDGGQTWQQAQAPTGMTAIAAMACPSTSTCISIGHAGPQPATARTAGGISSIDELPVSAP